MTIQEALLHNIPDVCIWEDKLVNCPQSYVYQSMEAYAEQTAISFAEWAAKNGWYLNKIGRWSNIGEASTNLIEVLSATKTTAELFTLYKSQNP